MIIRNEFHNTEVEIEVKHGCVSESALDAASKVLCGMSDCTCGAVPMNGYCVRGADGRFYDVISDEEFAKVV